MPKLLDFNKSPFSVIVSYLGLKDIVSHVKMNIVKENGRKGTQNFYKWKDEDQGRKTEKPEEKEVLFYATTMNQM